MTSYASVADLREYLFELPASAEDDVVLQKILNRVSSIVDEAVYPVVFSSSHSTSVERVTSYGGTLLYLPPHQVGGSIMVSYNGSAITGWSEDDDGDLYLATEWATTTPDLPYLVTAPWGYGSPPEAVVEVVLEMAVNIWHSRANARFSDVVGVQSEHSAAVGYEKGMTALQKQALLKVRNRLRRFSL